MLSGFDPELVPTSGVLAGPDPDPIPFDGIDSELVPEEEPFSKPVEPLPAPAELVPLLASAVVRATTV
jgi:hypothetical protein